MDWKLPCLEGGSGRESKYHPVLVSSFVLFVMPLILGSICVNASVNSSYSEYPGPMGINPVNRVVLPAGTFKLQRTSGKDAHSHFPQFTVPQFSQS